MTDRSGLQAVADAATATGEFAAVMVGRRPVELDATGQLYPRLWLRLRRFGEVSQGDPEWRTRVVTFSAEIAVSAGPGDDAELELDRLGNVLANLTAGAALGDNVVSLSGFGSGEYPDSGDGPVQSLRLTGSFTYLIDGFTGRDTGP